MVRLNFKCVVCGKRWHIWVDEKDTKRYFHVGDPDKHRDGSCGCTNNLVKKYPNIVMDSVCNACDS